MFIEKNLLVSYYPSLRRFFDRQQVEEFPWADLEPVNPDWLDAQANKICSQDVSYTHSSSMETGDQEWVVMEDGRVVPVEPRAVSGHLGEHRQRGQTIQQAMAGDLTGIAYVIRRSFDLGSHTQDEDRQDDWTIYIVHPLTPVDQQALQARQYVPEWARRTSRKRLDLSGVKLSQEDWAFLANLTELEELRLNRSAVTDGDLSKLKPLRWLQDLRLAENPLTGEGLINLKRNLQLEFLGLSNCPIDAEGIASIGQLAQLQGLCLDGTPVTGDELAPLQGLQHLEMLSVIRTQVRNLRYLPARLKELRLNGTAVTDDDLAPLQELPQLEDLDVANTQVTQEGLSRLGLPQPPDWSKARRY